MHGSTVKLAGNPSIVIIVDVVVLAWLLCSRRLWQPAGSNRAKGLPDKVAISGQWDDRCSLNHLGTMSILGQVTICKVWRFTDQTDGFCSFHTCGYHGHIEHVCMQRESSHSCTPHHSSSRHYTTMNTAT